MDNIWDEKLKEWRKQLFDPPAGPWWNGNILAGETPKPKGINHSEHDDYLIPVLVSNPTRGAQCIGHACKRCGKEWVWNGRLEPDPDFIPIQPGEKCVDKLTVIARQAIEDTRG